MSRGRSPLGWLVRAWRLVRPPRVRAPRVHEVPPRVRHAPDLEARAGRIADRSGRRPLMIIGAATFAVSVAGYGLADAVPVEHLAEDVEDLAARGHVRRVVGPGPQQVRIAAAVLRGVAPVRRGDPAQGRRRRDRAGVDWRRRHHPAAGRGERRHVRRRCAADDRHADAVRGNQCSDPPRRDDGKGRHPDVELLEANLEAFFEFDEELSVFGRVGNIAEDAD